MDQPWFPSPLRQAATGYLAFVIGKSGIFSPLGPRLAELVDACGCDRVVDLCAGGAGPYPQLVQQVEELRGRPTELVLTDLHPDPDALTRVAGRTRGGASVEAESIDARHVPNRLTGVRTLFDGLHHFRPGDARAVLEDAMRARAPILVAEASERSLAAIVGALLIPLFVLLVVPFVRPRSWIVLALTYLVPLVPLAIFWDGLISCLRTYSVQELRALVSGLDDRYQWEAGGIRHTGRTVSFLVGRPIR
jgi:hypothetical protein